jgi:membrane-bound ClpP family serine protease
MAWLIVILLILIGWVLLFLELFFIPGVTILALAGISLMVSGIYVSFAHYGSHAGWLTVAGTFAGVLISLFIAFKSGFWVKLGLKDTQRGAKMNLIDENKIKPGDVGTAQSKVAPIGTGYFNDIEYEVQTMGEYIEPKTIIEVIKIINNKIYVKPKTQT